MSIANSTATEFANSHIHWANSMYEFANEQVAVAEALSESGKFADSWLATIPARLAFLCDAVINLATLPWAICRFLVAGACAIAKWNRKTPFFVESKEYLLERSNHLAMDCVGCFFTSLAHRHRDADIALYVLVARYTIIAALAIYYGYFR